MSSAGTLLTDLDSKSPVADTDGDLVQKIMTDMNQYKNQIVMPSSGGIQQPMQHMNSSQRVISDPNPNTTYPTFVDPSTATAHLIGNSYPTPADFANVIRPYQGSSNQHHQYVFSPGSHVPAQKNGNDGTSSIYKDIIGHLKQPVLVAIIFFVISLPAINILISHYLPTLIRLGGDLTTPGLVLKAILAGGLFWVAQNVIAPLVAE